MIYLVTGGSGSGKSAYAEKMVLQAGAKERFYVATMEVFGEEGKQRVKRHQKLRQGKGFLTVECPRGLERLMLKPEKAQPENGDRVVLLECMGNLAANELFGGVEGEEGSVQERAALAKKRMKAGIENLERQCSLLVVVSNEVFSDGMDYGEETNGYIGLLGEMNCWLGKRAERVVEVVYGIPVFYPMYRKTPSAPA